MSNVLRINYAPARLSDDQRHRLEGLVHNWVTTVDRYVETSLSLMLSDMDDELEIVWLDVSDWANPQDFTLALEALEAAQPYTDPDLLGFIAALAEAIDGKRRI